MILLAFIYQALIILGLIAIFFITFLLNKKIKVKKGNEKELPEKCITCSFSSCIIKMSDANELKEELKKCLKEEENEEK